MLMSDSMKRRTYCSRQVFIEQRFWLMLHSADFRAFQACTTQMTKQVGLIHMPCDHAKAHVNAAHTSLKADMAMVATL